MNTFLSLQRLSVVSSACTLMLFVASQVHAITVGPGAFEYLYNSQDPNGTGVADPNAVLSDNVIFSGDGNGANNPPFYVNFYRFGTNPPGQSPPDNGSIETVTYTFDAVAGNVFDGDFSVTDRISVFNFLGNVRGEFSTDGGTTFTDYTLRGTEDLDVDGGYETNLLNVDGASSVILRYNLFSIAPPEQEDQVQLFRQANVNLGNLEPTPFVVTGVTVPFEGLVGDYNGDGTVNAADYTVWRDTLGSIANLAADGNGNNVIDAGDYDVWEQNFGSTAGAGSATAVPEPASLGLLLVAGAFVASRRNRHKRGPASEPTQDGSAR